jgi:hypothetical protein
MRNRRPDCARAMSFRDGVAAIAKALSEKQEWGRPPQVSGQASVPDRRQRRSNVGQAETPALPSGVVFKQD